MSFSKLKRPVNKCLRQSVFLFLFIAASHLCTTSYTNENLCTAEGEGPNAVSAPVITLFPEVTGTPWIQQLNELQRGTESWIRVSGETSELVSYIEDTEYNASGSITLAAGELNPSAGTALQQISGALGVEQYCESDNCCSDLSSCILQNKPASIRLCSECWNTGSQHSVNEELAPAQRLRPESWRSPIGIDPWIAVFQAENRSNATFFGEKQPENSELNQQDLLRDLNAGLLAEDQPVPQMNLNVEPKPGRMPQQRGVPSNSPDANKPLPIAGRNWRDCLVHWNASEATHGPLYFEEVNLERHGYSRGYFQPVVSGLRFFTTAPLLPGLMTIDRPFSLQYELGEERVGSCTPFRSRKTPWNTRAMLVQIGVVTGTSFIIP